MTDASDPVKTETPRPRSRLAVRIAAVFVLILAGLVAAGFTYTTEAVQAPDWLREKMDERLAQALPDLDIDYGNLEFVLQEDWRPRVSVQNVVVRGKNGAEIISVNSARVRFESRALLRGQLALTSLDLNGVFVTMARRADGRLSLSAGLGGGSAQREARDLASLVADLDETLLRPGWRALTDARVEALTVRYEDARAGRAWTVDGGHFALRREDLALDVTLDLSVLGGGADVARISANYAGEIGARAAQFGITITDLAARDIASQSPAFSWLQALDVPISGALRGGLGEDGTLQPLSASLQIGAGAIQPNREARPVPIEEARSYFTYLPEEQTLQFQELFVETALGSGRLEGRTRLAGDTGFDGLIGQVALSDLTVKPGEFYDAPVTLATAQADFRLSLRPFQLEVGRLEATDAGNTLTAQATIEAGREGWAIDFDAAMPALAPERLLAFWPKTEGAKTKKWLTENVLTAELADLNAAIRFRPGQRKPDIALGFDFRAADIRFLPEMPPIRGAQGHGSLIKDRFTAVVDRGGVEALEGGFIDLPGTSFIVPDVKVKDPTPGVIRLQARSSLTAALSMLDQPPLEVMRKADLPVGLAEEGQVELAGTLALPLEKGVKLDQIAFHFDGAVRDVVSSGLVPDKRLAAPLLVVTATDQEVNVAGAGTLEDVGFDVVWRLPLGEGRSDQSQVTGTAKLGPEALDAFNITLPPGSLEGQATADLTLDLVKDQAPRVTLTSDLQGLALWVPPLNWRKAASRPGTFALEVTLGPLPRVDLLQLEAPGLSANGEVRLTEDEQLDRVRLERLRVGNWLDAPVDLVGRGPERTPGIVVRGGRLDLRTATFAEGGNTGEIIPLTVALNRLQVTDALALDGLRGDFTVGSGLRGTFSGSVNGQAPIAGEVAPQDGRTALRLIAEDAGAVVAAAGALKQARGGALELLLEPVGTGGAFDGRLRVTDLRIIDAPTIAAILNAISIVGLVNELSGDGIYFSEVNADFRLSPNQVTLRQASAEGASMGLSMDGVLRTDTGDIAMQGVISPVYALNRIGSAFTRAGEGLFGFNYSILGTTDAPEVFVNPLTALAPGGLRNIFRSRRPEVPLVEGEPPPPEPEPRRRPVVTRGEDR